jgi:hypothetical protein
MDKLLEYYKRKIKEVKSMDKDKDYEGSHIIEDELHRKFLLDIRSGRIGTFKDVKKVATMLLGYKRGTRWYR